MERDWLKKAQAAQSLVEFRILVSDDEKTNIRKQCGC